MLTVLSLIIALSVMVLIHEIGHLVAARRAGIVVLEFGVGYPPRLLTLWRSRGTVVIGGKQIVIPRKFAWPQGLGVGSSVQFQTGPDRKGREVLTSVRPAESEEPAQAPTGRIELLDRGTLYSINAIPFGGFARMLGEEDPSSPGSFAGKRRLARVGVLMAGAGMNFVSAVLFFALAYALGAPAIAEPQNAVISATAEGSPAQAAGLRAGDVVVKADGVEIRDVPSLQSYTNEHLGTTITLTVLRDGELLEIPVVPRTNPPSGEGPIGITLGPRTEIRSYPWYQALWLGLKEAFSLAVFILSVPVQLIRGLIPAGLARPVGPVGIGQLVGDAVRYSLDTGWWFPVTQMLGSLSVALAVTNLLPLPALDGGRILFIIVEAIRGRRVEPAKEGLVHLVGMALLLAVMVLITWQDVVNPIPPFDWSRLF